ncbi:serine proteinase [Ephemerocybe angulata]|uniref:Serine proteinase n=1 Tax=Ephemerocybe angulata TaxID=980116 RepID=A0A8H6HUQ7_9AGAR|nr:serine proteinase [Tulosesus angulatus]
MAEPKKEPTTYIITLKKGVDKDAHFGALRPHLFGSDIKFTFKHLDAYSGTFTEEALGFLGASSDVKEIEEDTLFPLFDKTVQDQAPWGLNRISQGAPLSSTDPTRPGEYKYDNNARNTVNVYIIDTGIKVDLGDFEGRARWGYTFPGLEPDVDKHGHGTQVASVIGGASFGVFKNANLIAVKVVDDEGNVSQLRALAGIDFVIEAARLSGGCPSVVNMSWGERQDITSIDEHVEKMIECGIHVCAAAGNSNMDANAVSPARVASVNTVGASNISDERCSFSNFGTVVNVFAPGENIPVPTIGGPDPWIFQSGTSLACAHVTGLVAYFIALLGDMRPDIMSQYVVDHALHGVLRDIPAGTPNILINNGYAVLEPEDS